MSDDLRTDQVDQTASTRPAWGNASDATSRFVPIADGRMTRIDPPQQFANKVESPADAGIDLSSAPSGPPRHGEELLTQASQLVDHLRNQFSDLHRRDQAIAAQAQQLEQERRSVQLWKQEAEQELQNKADSLRQREASLAKSLAEQEQITDTLRMAQREVDRKKDAFDAERIKLLAEMSSKLDGDRERLQQAIAATNAERQQLQAEFDRQRESLEASIHSRLQELDAAKSRVREDVTEEILTAELRAEREALIAERDEVERLRANWIAEKDRELSELNREREIQAEATERVREELLAIRQQHANELETQQIEQEASLKQQQEEFARQRDLQMQELKHERAVLENRLRFQQEHLNKARQEIESAQNEFRREAQRSRSRLEEGEAVIRLRWSQLDRVRSLLEERERSVNREREMLFKSQRAFEQYTEHDREQIKFERDEWDRERSLQQSDLRRQQDMLALHVQNLEGRRERLDKLRAELEETHRTTLEMRMAIEEAWAQMTQAAGEDSAKQRIEAAQQQLSNHYRFLRETLTEQRRELDEMRQAFQQQKDEFHSEQQALTEWAATEERRLRDQATTLKTKTEQLDMRESAWRSASHRWVTEKIEAEAVIRDLLQQLTSLTEPTSPTSIWPRSEMPSYE